MGELEQESCLWLPGAASWFGCGAGAREGGDMGHGESGVHRGGERRHENGGASAGERWEESTGRGQRTKPRHVSSFRGCEEEAERKEMPTGIKAAVP